MVGIDLEDALAPDVPVRDVHHLGDTVVRFRFAQPRPLSSYQQFLLEGRTDVDTLAPSAPNRAAVKQLLDLARRALADGWAAQRESPLLRRAGVASAIDFLRFCADHFCRPTCLYTSERSYPIETFLLHGAGAVRRVRVPPGQSSEFLNGIDIDGFRARCCATCSHFSFSGMTWDMSNGTAGYCAKRTSDPEGEPPAHGLTGTFDLCEQHELVEEAARLASK